MKTGRVGEKKKSSSTQDIEGAATKWRDSMVIRPGLLAQLRPQRDKTMSASGGIDKDEQEISTQRHFSGAAGVRTERGTSSEYVTLVSEELMGDTAAMEPLGSGENPDEMETKDMVPESVRGIKSPRGTNTPGVEGLPRGDKTSGVTPKGKGVPDEDRQGRGEKNSSSTQDIEGAATKWRVSMVIRPGLLAQLRPQRLA